MHYSSITVTRAESTCLWKEDEAVTNGGALRSPNDSCTPLENPFEAIRIVPNTNNSAGYWGTLLLAVKSDQLTFVNEGKGQAAAFHSFEIDFDNVAPIADNVASSIRALDESTRKPFWIDLNANHCLFVGTKIVGLGGVFGELGDCDYIPQAEAFRSR
ncbi:hypothetical protein FOMPIDRAFT_1054351 [Fomitopsis schrenkii]|uniref:Uncharacterized protein n=1 Tax=Fomitopsis schrenkii TaxID=2126942 RepID=S8DPQ3_FOMSC|nr:hypothetical protein FOMPIDRAFT_1054351 [Fomitopsis schrenkii]